MLTLDFACSHHAPKRNVMENMVPHGEVQRCPPRPTSVAAELRAAQLEGALSRASITILLHLPLTPVLLPCLFSFGSLSVFLSCFLFPLSLCFSFVLHVSIRQPAKRLNTNTTTPFLLPFRSRASRLLCAHPLQRAAPPCCPAGAVVHRRWPAQARGEQHLRRGHTACGSHR